MRARDATNDRRRIFPSLTIDPVAKPGGAVCRTPSTAPRRVGALTELSPRRLATATVTQSRLRSHALTNVRVRDNAYGTYNACLGVGQRASSYETAMTPKFTPTIPPLSARSSRRHGAGATGRPGTARHKRQSQRISEARRSRHGHSIGMSIAEAMQKFWKRLRVTDRNDILRYKHVWYVPTLEHLADDTRALSRDPGANSGGGEDGLTFRIRKGEHVAFRFEMLNSLGAGNFGQVVRCFDHKYKREVALKLISPEETFASQARVEVAVLKRVEGGTSRIVKMLEHLKFRDRLCVVFELLHINLYEFLEARAFAKLDIQHVRHIAQQMVDALVYLKHMQVVHCDIKPENILLEHPGSFDVKLIDFGSACFQGKQVYTYIQSRFYRAPEVMLGIDYGHPIDVWSLACVLAELATGKTLFVGDDEARQLSAITSRIGPPPRRILSSAAHSDRRVDFHVCESSFARSRRDDKRSDRTSSKHKTRSKRTKVIDINDDRFNAFLLRALHWNPSRRLTPDAARRHSFLQKRRAVAGEAAVDDAARTGCELQTAR